MAPKPSHFMVEMVSFNVNKRWLKSQQDDWKMAPKPSYFMVKMDSMILWLFSLCCTQSEIVYELGAMCTKYSGTDRNITFSPLLTLALAHLNIAFDTAYMRLLLIV
jgi:hypothetical protein